MNQLDQLKAFTIVVADTGNFKQLAAFAPRQAMAPGAVKVAVRPEAWQLGSPGGPGVAGILSKSAYLGSQWELSFDTGLGSVFVVAADLSHLWTVGDAASLSLGQRGVSVVAV